MAFIYPTSLINYRNLDLEYSKNPIYKLYDPYINDIIIEQSNTWIEIEYTCL